MIINMYTDGSVRPHNPGPGGFAAAVWLPWDTSDSPGLMRSGFLGEEVSNNQAEYMALIAGLDLLLEQEQDLCGHHEIRIHSDSMLVINHVNRRWRLRSQLLRPLFEEAQARLAELRERVDRVEVVHVKGHRGNPGNEYVDKMAGQVVKSKIGAAPRYVLLLE